MLKGKEQKTDSSEGNRKMRYFEFPFLELLYSVFGSGQPCNGSELVIKVIMNIFFHYLNHSDLKFWSLVGIN